VGGKRGKQIARLGEEGNRRRGEREKQAESVLARGRSAILTEEEDAGG